MQILYPKDFKATTNSSNLKDYITYLEERRNEARSVLESAKDFTLDDNIVTEINRQLEEILRIISIIESYESVVVINSIDRLSLEELQKYFKDYKNPADNEREDLENQITELKAKLKEVSLRIEEAEKHDSEYANYFSAVDTSNFFVGTDPKDYLNSVLSQTIGEEITTSIRNAIKVEGLLQDVELSDEQIVQFTNNVLNVLKKGQQILKFSGNARSQLVQSLFTDKGLCSSELYGGLLCKESGLYILLDIMNQSRLQTEFFVGLSEENKSVLIEERLNGALYNELAESYRRLTAGEKLPSSVSQKDLELKDGLENEISELEEKLDVLISNNASANSFLSNSEAMKQELKSIVSSIVGKPILVDDINEAIKNTKASTEGIEHDLRTAAQELNSKKVTLGNIRRILDDPNYSRYFEIVKDRKIYQLYKDLGLNSLETTFRPFVITEFRRTDQVTTLVNLFNELDAIKKEMNEFYSSLNGLTRRLPATEKRLKEFKDKYQACIDTALEKMRSKNLFVVNTPSITFNSDMNLGFTVVEPGASETVIKELEDLTFMFNRQTFWDMTSAVDENTKEAILMECGPLDNWDMYISTLMESQIALMRRLFNFSKSNGYYDFSITAEERRKLVEVQKTLCDIAKMTYDNRVDYRDRLEKANLEYDEAIAELGNTDYTREELEAYSKELEEQITSLASTLYKNRTTCEKFGVHIDFNDINISMDEEELPSPFGAIENLGLNGVHTVEDAELYSSVITGLDGFYLEPEDVKSFYIQKK